MSRTTIVFAWFIAACATGGNDGGGGGIDAAVARDAATGSTVDAAVVRLDASVSPDAQVSQLPDAGTGSGSGLFCTVNSNCTVAGECCVTLGGPSGFCAPGTVVLGQCVPQ